VVTSGYLDCLARRVSVVLLVIPVHLVMSERSVCQVFKAFKVSNYLFLMILLSAIQFSSLVLIVLKASFFRHKT